MIWLILKKDYVLKTLKSWIEKMKNFLTNCFSCSQLLFFNEIYDTYWMEWHFPRNFVDSISELMKLSFCPLFKKFAIILFVSICHNSKSLWTPDKVSLKYLSKFFIFIKTFHDKSSETTSKSPKKKVKKINRRWIIKAGF